MAGGGYSRKRVGPRFEGPLDKGRQEPDVACHGPGTEASMKSKVKSRPGRESRALVLAREVVSEIDEKDRAAVLTWARQLLAIRDTKTGRLRRMAAAVRVSANRSVLTSVIRRMHGQLRKAGYRGKQLLWDDRNWAARFALSGVAAGVAVGGGANAGLAALGSAIGVPLWLVTASGGAFLGALVDEIGALLPDHEPEAIPPEIEREIEQLLSDDDLRLIEPRD